MEAVNDPYRKEVTNDTGFAILLYLCTNRAIMHKFSKPRIIAALCLACHAFHLCLFTLLSAKFYVPLFVLPFHIYHILQGCPPFLLCHYCLKSTVPQPRSYSRDYMLYISFTCLCSQSQCLHKQGNCASVAISRKERFASLDDFGLLGASTRMNGWQKAMARLQKKSRKVGGSLLTFTDYETDHPSILQKPRVTRNHHRLAALHLSIQQAEYHLGGRLRSKVPAQK